MENIIKEACVETLEEAIYAYENGAQRLELCARLDLGGLTPSLELTQEVISRTQLPTMVMIRCRGGNFEYNQEEITLMKEEMLSFSEIPITGFVFGFTIGRELDLETIAAFAQLANGKEVCIHKAIDTVDNILEAVIDLQNIKGVHRILTSGGAETAMEGANNLAQMIKLSSKIQIMPAGKVTASNLSQLHDLLEAQEYHGRKIV